MEISSQGLNQSCRCQPTPQPQQRGIQTTSVTYTTAHSNARFLIHWARTWIKPKTSWFPVRFVNHWATTGTPVQGSGPDSNCNCYHMSVDMIHLFLWIYIFKKFIGLTVLFSLSRKRKLLRTTRALQEYLWVHASHSSSCKCVYFRFQSPTLAVSDHWLQNKSCEGIHTDLFIVLLSVV